uniref:(California timema) hypothetical protein n=1 Tax=Timema californicum TaxID=61474 RepID=A0A7R9P6P0_TIMCA|nr:unnamed protein product [Timema californicum]
MPHRVAVVGGGVIGLTTAVALQERLLPSVDVTVLSENFSPDTTGDGAAGLWEPYITGNTSVTNITKWAGQTYRMFRELWQREDGQEVGLSMLPITNLTDHLSDNTPSFWSEVVMGYRMLDPAQLARLGKEHGSKYTKGYTYVTFICEATKFLPYLQNRLLAGGGHLVRRKVTSLDELAREDYRVIVNCTGLQARHLVGDTSVVPVRGQVLRVSAPWQNEVIIDLSGDGHHIIPNQESVVIGGTHQEGSWDLNVDPKDTQYILEGCKRIKPALKHAPLQRAWVGLRPSRSSVRLELGDPIRGEGRTTLVYPELSSGYRWCTTTDTGAAGSPYAGVVPPRSQTFCKGHFRTPSSEHSPGREHRQHVAKHTPVSASHIQLSPRNTPVINYE